MPWLARICTCRYSGRYQANFDTTTWVTSAVEAMPLSISRGSTFACTTPSVQPALATRARRRVRLQHLLAARQVLGQRADVAARLLAWLTGRRGRRQIIVGWRRWCDAGLQIVQLERELLGDERRQPLRALPEHHLLERLHRHT